mmetsp:Transcript_46651/g.110931  ORF Transcript_46651/g.110931 Transcript_46651/m.110931 type:complete len:315 (-) Transcript_46651:241-1185(-)
MGSANGKIDVGTDAPASLSQSESPRQPEPATTEPLELVPVTVLEKGAQTAPEVVTVDTEKMELLRELETLRSERITLQSQVVHYAMIAGGLMQQLHMVQAANMAAAMSAIHGNMQQPANYAANIQAYWSSTASAGKSSEGNSRHSATARKDSPPPKPAAPSDWSKLAKGTDGRPSLEDALAMADIEDAANYGKFSQDEVCLMNLEARVDAEQGWDESNGETFACDSSSVHAAIMKNTSLGLDGLIATATAAFDRERKIAKGYQGRYRQRQNRRSSGCELQPGLVASSEHKRHFEGAKGASKGRNKARKPKGARN